MPFEDLVENCGGQMLKPFTQEKYAKKQKFAKHLDEGLCAALSTVWVSKRARGDDFCKYLDTNDARHSGDIAKPRVGGRQRGEGTRGRSGPSSRKGLPNCGSTKGTIRKRR
jgi:hypothetical protein